MSGPPNNFHPRGGVAGGMMQRPFGPGSGPPPFRGPGPGNFMPPGGPPPNPRGMSQGPRPPFNGRNFDQNFGVPPPMQIPNPGMMRPEGGRPPMNPPGMFMPPPMGMPRGPLDGKFPLGNKPPVFIDPSKEIWVETLAQDGRIYFYHSKTRETVWNTPTGDNIQIIKQSEAYLLASIQQNPSANQTIKAAADDVTQNSQSDNNNTSKPPPDGDDQPSTEKKAGESMETSNDKKSEGNNASSSSKDKNISVSGSETMMIGPPITQLNPSMVPHRPHLPPMQRPVFSHMIQGLPPMRNMIPGLVPNMGGPHRPILMQGGPGAPIMPPPVIQHDLNRPESWREHQDDNGRPYWYNIHTFQTTWNKPSYLTPNAMQENANAQEKDGANKDEGSKGGETANNESSKKKDEDIENNDAQQQRKKRQQPIARYPVPGTPWCVVWTGDGKVFFYNPTTSLSMWVRPEELKDRTDVDKVISDPPYKRKIEDENSVDAGGIEPAKKKLKTAVAVASSSGEEVPMEQQVDDGEISSKTAEDEPVANKEDDDKDQASLEDRAKVFQEMLLERKVSAFSTWEKELHKIVFDKRYTLLNAKERKQYFDEFVRTRAEVERKERKAQLLKAREDFKALVSEVNYSAKMSFSEFAAKNSKDGRFRAVEKMKERETLFNEFVKETRKRRDDESRDKAEKAKRDFFLLMEEKHVDKCSRWGRAREKMVDDARYSQVEAYQREEWWNEFCSGKDKNTQANNEEMERKRRAEESLKARQREVEAQKAERSKELESERYKHRFDEATQHFRALLVDMVRNPDQSWSDTRKQLKKDNRWDLAKLLTRDEKERHFYEHIDSLKKKRKTMFQQLLEETDGIGLNTKWKEAKKLIKSDPRYSKFSSSDRKRESEFQAYIKNKYINAKGDLRELLKECKLITYKTHSTIEANPQHMKEIKAILQKDKRYLVLSCDRSQRDEVIRNYIEDLSTRGRPPPPTATEPSRRGPK